MSLQDFTVGFQVTEKNPLLGLEERFELLKRLGTTLQNNPYFPHSELDCGRPSHILNYLFPNYSSHQENHLTLSVEIFWEALFKGLKDVWPETRSKFILEETGEIISLGDSWTSHLLRLENNIESSENIVTFHKLTQWMCYSLLEPLQRCLAVHLTAVNLLTVLPEYRNGGLLVDFGVLTLKDSEVKRGLENALKLQSTELDIPMFDVNDEVIVQWRALTICLVDELAVLLRKKLGFHSVSSATAEEEFPLAKILEAGTWKAGREIAKFKRPKTQGPPINIKSDGTVF